MIACGTPVGRLLDSLVPQLHYVPQSASRIRFAEDLPSSLRGQTRVPQWCGAWRAWRCGTQVWFVSGRCICPRGEPLLYAAFFDVDGRFMSGGTWRRRDGVWTLEVPAGDITRCSAGDGSQCLR